MRLSGCMRTGRTRAIGAAVAMTAACGCISEFINPDFLRILGGGEQVANLPGDAPALLIEVENQTANVVEAQLSLRGADGEVTTPPSFVIPPGEKFGRTFVCPVTELTLGDVANLDATGAVVFLGNGGANDPLVEVEPFGILLQEFINYECGDRVTFQVRTSAETSSGYRIFAIFQHAEP